MIMPRYEAVETDVDATKQEGWMSHEIVKSEIEGVALLRSWYNEDPTEQKESLGKLKIALDKDRLSDRKLFP